MTTQGHRDRESSHFARPKVLARRTTFSSFCKRASPPPTSRIDQGHLAERGESGPGRACEDQDIRVRFSADPEGGVRRLNRRAFGLRAEPAQIARADARTEGQ